MKRYATAGLALLIVSLSFAGCAKQDPAEHMAAMFPKEAVGLMVVDIHRALQTEPAQKMITSQDNAGKYQEFVKETGIDPQKDIFYLSGAMIGDIEHPEGAVIVNLKYSKDVLLGKLKDALKEKGGELKESVYEGLTIYEIHPPVKSAESEEGEKPEAEGKTEAKPEEPKAEQPPAEKMEALEKPGYGAFLDESHITLGTEAAVKAVIDVLKGKKETVLKNADLSKLIKESNKAAMFWAALSIPPEAVKKMTESNPMLASLAGVNSLLLSFDYRDKAVQAEIKLKGGDAAKNKQIADFLTGMKALGGMAGSSKPAVGELMNKIEVTSGPDFVSVKADIPEELMNKLGEEAKKAIPQMEKKEPEAESKTK